LTETGKFDLHTIKQKNKKLEKIAKKTIGTGKFKKKLL
jgi:hypothetical protein